MAVKGGAVDEIRKLKRELLQITEYGCRVGALLSQAIRYIQEERNIMKSSHEDMDGNVWDVRERQAIARYDKWLKAARASLGKSPPR